MTLLRATNHPIDIVVIANMEGRKAYLHPTRLQHLLIPGILQACQDTTQTINRFPTQTPHALTVATPLPPPHPTAPQRPPTHHAIMHTTTWSFTYAQPHHSSQRRPKTLTTTRHHIALRAHNPTHNAAHHIPTSAHRLII